MRRALGVSLASRIWGAGLGILAVPIYVRVLGIESYGLIGLFASLQVLISFLDFGLGTTMVREFGRLGASPDGRTEMRDIARTCELTYVAVGCLIGAGVAVLAPWLLDHWLNLDRLSREEAGTAVAWGALALAVQWPSALYGSGLEGLQRQAALGFLAAATGTGRVVLALSAIWFIAPRLDVFFAANALAGLAHTLAARRLFWRSLGAAARPPRFLRGFLTRSRGFAGAMTGIFMTSIVLTQQDKIILSKVLALPDFGIYALTSALAGGLYVLIGPVFGTLYPRLCATVASGSVDDTRNIYHLASQFLALLLIPALAVVALYSSDILFVWTGDAEISQRAHWPLVFLFAGNTINGLMNAPYALQLASGWPGLALASNLVAVFLLVPVTYFLAIGYGPAGGAAAWFLLNTFFILIAPHIMHRRLLTGEVFNWYVHDIGRAVLAAGSAVAALRWALPTTTTRPLLGLAVTGVWLAALGAAAVALPAIRQRLPVFRR